MTREEVVAKVNQFLVEDFEIEASKLGEDKLITTEIGIDSLDMVDIIVRVHEEFGFKLEKEELMGVKTLGDFYDLLMKHVG
ncbi:MAG: phosphopantetheine-binding protein [Paludibacteraceae bacterium]|nr:phosphopantetheine-binding protein [Paludibacteraceae bacterium]